MSGAFADISRTPVQTPPALEFAAGKTGITLEPTIYLAEKARYLNCLHELRRINEGDDTADSPGYSLNLVRIPVSVLPGKCTEIGHGAEITMTLTPYLSDELLPTTFRNLVENDVVDEITFPVTQFINEPTNRVYFEPATRAADLDELVAYVDSHSVQKMIEAVVNYELSSDKSKSEPEKEPSLATYRWRPSLEDIFSRPEWAWVDEVMRRAYADVDTKEEDKEEAKKKRNASAPQASEIETLKSDDLAGIISTGHSAAPGTKSRPALLPFPRSQMSNVYGIDFARTLGEDAYSAFAKARTSKPCPDSGQLWIQLPDVKGYFQEETAAAYKFLSTPCNASLWRYCTPDLAAAIRGHNVPFLMAQRLNFKNEVDALTGGPEGGQKHTTTAALAWAIIVDSALLTDQLVQDMKETAASKGCACARRDGWITSRPTRRRRPARRSISTYSAVGRSTSSPSTRSRTSRTSPTPSAAAARCNSPCRSPSSRGSSAPAT